MEIDIVIPIKSSLIRFAIDKTIPSIIKHLNFRTIYIITNKSNFHILENKFLSNVKLLDEDLICNNLTLNNIKKYFVEKKINPNRAGWYFQQFLKLSVHQLEFITDNYLVWDADAILLNPINFISKENKTYFEKTQEYNHPYFETILNLLSLEKQVNHSFIGEYMVFNKKIVASLLKKITTEKQWWYKILDSIKITHLKESGFSEYELYGNYIVKYYPDNYKIRSLSKTRKGAKLLGLQPSGKSLKLFSLGFDYLSFETWHKKYQPETLRYFLIVFKLSFATLKKTTLSLFKNF
ncbi:hypothetical protein [Polaribacter sp. R77954]|uniref:hypothetical protein n=1 Tax=Polaribacter sp. R77954 TaxID=3093870 RepID=UPI0037CC61D1